jgi:hypothetical protein
VSQVVAQIPGARVDRLSGSYGFVTPSPAAVPGISCIRPCAPAELVAFGLKPDSCAITAWSSFGSTP